MTDLINRADALRELNGACSNWEDDAKVQEIIMAIPSAELVLQTPQTYGKSINPSNAEVVADYISRADAIEAVRKIVPVETEIDSTLLDKAEVIVELSALPSADAVSREDYHNLLTASNDIDRALREYQAKEEAEAKPTMTEDVREALMRLTMCAREECGMCKYKDECGFDFQYNISTENMNTILDALSAEAVQGEWGHMIAHGTDGSHWYEYECSHCGEVVLRPYNFCPNCGAKMFREDGEV